jgi:hypothetical protein
MVDQEIAFFLPHYFHIQASHNFPVNKLLLFTSCSLQLCRLWTAVNTACYSQFVI